ncbi:MAG TPA: hypothetical protein VF188_02480 [Longimicrobiales bacterium]
MTTFRIRPLTSTQQAEFEDLARQVGAPSGYSWLQPHQLPTTIPATLRTKLPTALLMWERTPSGTTILVCNGIRYDAKANALDQEPFGVAVYPSGASTAGIFAHHGSWNGRTAPLPPAIGDIIGSSSLWDYYPLSEVPSTSSGPLTDLKRTSYEGAFRAVVSQLLQRSTSGTFGGQATG